MLYQPPFDPAFTPAGGIYNSDANAAYVNGNAEAGTEGSYFPAEAIEHPQRELIALIRSGGLSPLIGTLDQAAEAAARVVSRAITGTATGTANAHVVTALTNAVVPRALFDRMILMYEPPATNTGALTVAPFGLAATSVVDPGGTDLAGNEVRVGRMTMMWFSSALGKFKLFPWSLPSAPVRGSQQWSAGGSYTFTVPAGVFAIEATGIAAGGKGGADAGSGGTGGGAGGYASSWLSVVPGEQLAIGVGAGGVAAGASGGDVTITRAGGVVLLRATGGGPGSDDGGSGGASGTGAVGQLTAYGGGGGLPMVIGSFRFGGHGGGSFFGSGGLPNGGAGAPPGTGGAGGGYGGSSAGGNGRDGYVGLRY